MTLTEIFAEIREKYPNAVDDTSIVRKMDYLQKRLYRKMRKQTFLSFYTVPGLSTYPLPVNIDDVFQVDVGNTSANRFHQYYHKKINDSSTKYSRYYSFIGDSVAGDWIDIYPTPTAFDDTVVVWFYEQPETLVVGGASPTLDSDYHMLFVYWVCKEIAENYRDFDISSGYTQQYNDLEKEMMGTFQDPEVIIVHSESGW